MAAPLEEYRHKRDFTHTPEPAGSPAASTSGDAPATAPSLRYVVQKHAATALHYDFRLELDGVLMSWAVPKGPSLDTHDKRLAVHVEDHPIDYGSFEGGIPKGEYGGGTVMVWDAGTWEPHGDPRAGLAKGDFKFTLHGSKLNGLWVLVRMKPRPGGKRENWLLIKERDEFVRPREEYDVIAEQPDSVSTGRSLEEIAASASKPPSGADAAADAASASARADAVAAPSVQRPDAPVAPVAPIPAVIDIELATLVDTPPVGPEWVAEAKYDGYRVLIVLEGCQARVFTRSHADWTDRFVGLAHAAEKLPADSAVLDGEAVVFDHDGVSRFELLRTAIGAHPTRIAFAAFDLLFLGGHDLRGLSLLQRKELLRTLLEGESVESPMRYADHLVGGGPELFAHACSAKLEGVVCKRADSLYTAGRGRDWQKVKCRHTQELVVGGFTEGLGSREALGALLVGTYEGDRLVYSGRVGSGLTEATLASIVARLGELARTTSPFDPPPRVSGHVVHWAEPELVIEAAFREWTSEGVLRQPVFLGVREDKSAREVVREVADEPQGEAGGDAAADPAEPQDAPLDPPADPPASARGFGADASVLGVRVTNPEKRLFPESPFPKLSLAEYYAAVAAVMLPHVADRPLTLVRCPIGHGHGCFYQRHPDLGLPANVHTLSHALTGHGEPDIWLTVDSAEGLVALAQMGVLEIHTWLSHADSPQRPDRMVFDLDPGPGVSWTDICTGAELVRTECTKLGFRPFVKSTGSKGLHVVLPIEPVWEYVRIRALSKAIVDSVAEHHPETITDKMAKNLRGNRIFFDYLRNSEGASAVAPYSTRNLQGPPCAVPLKWDELMPGLDIRTFTPARVIERVAAGIDPWATIEEHPVGARILGAAEKALGL